MLKFALHSKITNGGHGHRVTLEGTGHGLRSGALLVPAKGKGDKKGLELELTEAQLAKLVNDPHLELAPKSPEAALALAEAIANKEPHMVAKPTTRPKGAPVASELPHGVMLIEDSETGKKESYYSENVPTLETWKAHGYSADSYNRAKLEEEAKALQPRTAAKEPDPEPEAASSEAAASETEKPAAEA